MGEDQKVQSSSSSNVPEPRMDLETESASKKLELRRQKRKKLAIFFALFTVFQIAILLVTVLVVLKIRTPQLRVKSGTFGFVMNSDAAGTNPSFNITMYPNIGIRNTNFGPYKYGEGRVQFFYRGSPVGSVVVIDKSTVGMRSTKKVVRGAAVEVISSRGNLQVTDQMANDLSSGKLVLTSEARLDGKVEMLFLIKKKKSINMNCSMQLDVFTRQFHQINCN